MAVRLAGWVISHLSFRSSINQCIHPSFHPSTHPSSSSINQCIHPSTHPSTHPSIYPSLPIFHSLRLSHWRTLFQLFLLSPFSHSLPLIPPTPQLPPARSATL